MRIWPKIGHYISKTERQHLGGRMDQTPELTHALTTTFHVESAPGVNLGQPLVVWIPVGETFEAVFQQFRRKCEQEALEDQIPIVSAAEGLCFCLLDEYGVPFSVLRGDDYIDGSYAHYTQYVAVIRRPVDIDTEYIVIDWTME